MSKTALICGISGQDGALLARQLLHKGYHVIGTSRDAQATEFANLVRLGIYEHIKLESMPLDDLPSIQQLIERVHPNEIYNFAGQSSVGLSFAHPVETITSHSNGTLNLLEAIRLSDSNIRFCNTASGECFGDTNGIAGHEETPFRPRSPYAVAKAAAFWESICYRDAYGMFVCNSILFNHESPLRPTRFVTRKVIRTACRIANGSDEKLKLGNLSIKRDWGWADEYVDAMWRMLQQDRPDDFVIATGESHSLEEFVETTFRLLGLAWQQHVEIDQALLRPSEIMENRGNARKAQEQLGWKATLHMNEVIERMIAIEMGDLPL